MNETIDKIVTVAKSCGYHVGLSKRGNLGYFSNGEKVIYFEADGDAWNGYTVKLACEMTPTYDLGSSYHMGKCVAQEIDGEFLASLLSSSPPRWYVDKALELKKRTGITVKPLPLEKYLAVYDYMYQTGEGKSHVAPA